MADLRVVISALNKASGDLAKVKGDIKDVGDAGKDAKGGVDGFADGIGSILGKAALVAGSVAAVATALREVYDLAKEGAELEYARTRFDNLAASIGTVSDALLSDLKDATGGMMSDAELVAGAADFMALGLAKSHDEVVRLTDVAGALGMNMNQLVLTLTNQTTMRFDALGVSVDGFDAKVKTLEDSGMSASEAFTEAFLQQAEAQIGLVGNKAETSAGQIQIMESAWKNMGDATKLSMADALDGIAPVMTSVANHMTDNVEISQQWKTAIDQLKAAKDKDLITGKEYNELMRDIGVHSGMGAATAEQLATAQAKVNQIYGYAEEGAVTYTDAITAGKAQLVLMAGQAEDTAGAVEELTEAQKKMIAEHEKITTLDNNYKGIIDLAYKYTDILDEIAANEETIRELQADGAEDHAEEIDGLIAKNEELKGSMTELANRVTLDMFQATIAIGGVTEAELAAYMQMAIDMGLMSEEGAKAAITAYNNAIETINGYEIDEKTGNVTIDAVSAFVTLDLLQQYSLLDKEQRVFVKTYYGTSGGYDPYENYTGPGTAVGGSVNAGQPYTWQEYGYRGEVFVPSADGFVLSRADAERALARALYGGGSAIDPAAIGKAIAQAMSGVTAKGKGGNVYNLTMPTSSNPADVRTAFELMEAWA
jgi:hypothetical protein